MSLSTIVSLTFASYVGLDDDSNEEQGDDEDLPVFSSPIKQEPRPNGLDSINVSPNRNNGYSNNISNNRMSSFVIDGT